jgi:hypothetical protein
MRSLLALFLSATLFLSTSVAQTQNGAQAAPLNLNGLWDSLSTERTVSPKHTINVAVNTAWTDTI